MRFLWKRNAICKVLPSYINIVSDSLQDLWQKITLDCRLLDHFNKVAFSDSLTNCELVFEFLISYNGFGSDSNIYKYILGKNGAYRTPNFILSYQIINCIFIIHLIELKFLLSINLWATVHYYNYNKYEIFAIISYRTTTTSVLHGS